MKDRQKKKAEKRKRELIHALLDVALDINGLSGRTQCRTGNRPTAFFEFSGHVGLAEVEIYRNGWTNGISPDSYYRAFTNNAAGLAKANRALNAKTPGAATPRASR